MVQSRHRFDSLDPILDVGDDLSKKIASAFITLGATSLGCSTKVSREDLFDRGAAIFARDMHVERQLARAAARGDFERAQAPAPKFLYEEFGAVERNGLMGPGIIAVEQTQAQHQVMDAEQRLARAPSASARYSSGIITPSKKSGALPIDDGVDVAPGHLRVGEGAGRGLADEPGHRDVAARGLVLGLADADDGDSFLGHQPSPSRTHTRFCCRHGPDVAWATPRVAVPAMIRSATSPMRVRPATITGLAASAPPDGFTFCVVAEAERLAEDQLLVA